MRMNRFFHVANATLAVMALFVGGGGSMALMACSSGGSGGAGGVGGVGGKGGETGSSSSSSGGGMGGGGTAGGGGMGGSGPDCTCACHGSVTATPPQCGNVCDDMQNGNPNTPNFCNGVAALTQCGMCLMTNCGFTATQITDGTLCTP